MFVGMQVGSPRTLWFGDTVPKVNADCKIHVIIPAPLLIARFISEFYENEYMIMHSVVAA